jgi:hypothetical protein
MRGGKTLTHVGVWLAGVLAVLAFTGSTALAAGSSSPPVCPPASLPQPPGCPVASGGSGGSSATTSAPVRTLPADQVLSDEMSFTQFAYVRRIANIYSRPSTHSRRVSKLRWWTEDNFSSIYLLLRAHWVTQRQEWIKIRIPGRPNGRTGWVQRNALRRFHMTHAAIVVNRRTLHLYYYSNGHLIWSAPVGIGKPSTPTPAGHFWIREKFSNLPRSSGYWPYAFGTTDYSTLKDWEGGGVVGIHGPFGAPNSAIPGRISHGCIRLHTWDDAWLGRHLQLGTPLRVI